LIPFQYKEFPPTFIEEMNGELMTHDILNQKMWNRMSAIGKYGTKIVTLTILFISSDDMNKFLLMSITMGSLTSSVNSFLSFLNQWNRIKNDWTAYTELWTPELTYIEDPVKLNLMPDLIVTSVNISKGTFRVKCDQEFSFGRGTKILVQGKSNSGKTTFIEGLTGKLPGVTMSIGTPENYYWTVADMFQTIREKFPSSKVTIRNFFKDEQDNMLIERCLRIIFCGIRDYDDFIRPFVGDKSHVFDVQLSEALSGGQKTRLCLATRMYELIKYRKTILILDEPEQGLDAETKMMVLKNIFHVFADKTIVMISHLCECERKSLECDFTYHVNIDNGIITVLKIQNSPSSFTGITL